MERSERQLVPTSVIIAAAIISLVAVNHLVMRALPALRALDVYGMLELFVVGVCLSIAWGMLTLRRWAWAAGVALSGIGCLFPLFMMQDLDAFQLQTGFPGHTIVIQFLLFIELASFSVFVLLMSQASKSAFIEEHPARQRGDRGFQESAATATQTVHG